MPKLCNPEEKKSRFHKKGPGLTKKRKAEPKVQLFLLGFHFTGMNTEYSVKRTKSYKAGDNKYRGNGQKYISEGSFDYLLPVKNHYTQANKYS